MLFGAGMEEANGHGDAGFNFEREIDSYIPVEVTETRLTGQRSSSPQLLVHLTCSQSLLLSSMYSESLFIGYAVAAQNSLCWWQWAWLP